MNNIKHIIGLVVFSFFLTCCADKECPSKEGNVVKLVLDNNDSLDYSYIRHLETGKEFNSKYYQEPDSQQVFDLWINVGDTYSSFILVSDKENDTLCFSYTTEMEYFGNKCGYDYFVRNLELECSSYRVEYLNPLNSEKGIFELKVRK